MKNWFDKTFNKEDFKAIGEKLKQGAESLKNAGKKDDSAASENIALTGLTKDVCSSNDDCQSSHCCMHV